MYPDGCGTFAFIIPGMILFGVCLFYCFFIGCGGRLELGTAVCGGYACDVRVAALGRGEYEMDARCNSCCRVVGLDLT